MKGVQAGVAERRTAGLWCCPGVPHKGWTCFDVEDLEDDQMICEMCQTAEIRYAHYMRHPDYAAGTLRVGCICAEHMCAGYDGKEAERHMRSAARRRNSWQTAKWRESRSGNSVYYRTRDGFVVIVFWRGEQRRWYDVLETSPSMPRAPYGFCIKRHGSDEAEVTNGHDLETEGAAKEAAFRALENLREPE